MSAALARYANPAEQIGHAGPDAPVHDDQRLELARTFVADIPPTTINHRADGLASDLARLRRVRDMLCDALEDLVHAHAALRGNNDSNVRAGRNALQLGRTA